MGGEPRRRPLAGQLGTGGRWEGNMEDGHSQVSWEREGDGRETWKTATCRSAGNGREMGTWKGTWDTGHSQVSWEREGDGRGTWKTATRRSAGNGREMGGEHGRRPLAGQLGTGGRWEGNMEDGHSQVSWEREGDGRGTWKTATRRSAGNGREMGGEPGRQPLAGQLGTGGRWEGNLGDSHSQVSWEQEGDGRGTWETATRRSAGNGREMGGEHGRRPLAGQLGTGGRWEGNMEDGHSQVSWEREGDGRGTWKTATRRSAGNGREMGGEHGRRPLAGQLGTGGRWEGNLEDSHSQVSWEREGDGRGTWKTATRRSAGNGREMGGEHGRRPLAGQLGTGGRWEGNMEDGHSQVSWEREGDGRGTWKTATRRSAGNGREMGGEHGRRPLAGQLGTGGRWEGNLEDGHSQVSWEREGDGRGTWKTATRRSAGNGREMGGEHGRRPLAGQLGTGGRWEGNMEDGHSQVSWEREGDGRGTWKTATRRSAGNGREMGGEHGRRPLAGQLGTGGRWEGNMEDGHSQVSWEREGDGRGTWKTATRRSAGNGREMGGEHGRRPLAGQLGTGGRWEGNMEDGHSQVSWEREGDGRGTWKTATRRSAGNGREMGGEPGRRPLAGQLGTGGRWEGNMEDGHSQVSWEREGDGRGTGNGREMGQTATRRSAGNGREMGGEPGRRPLAGQLGTGGRWEGNMEDGHSQVSWEREGDGRGTWKTATRRSAGNGREMGGEPGRRPLAGQLGTGGRWEGNLEDGHSQVSWEREGDGRGTWKTATRRSAGNGREMEDGHSQEGNLGGDGHSQVSWEREGDGRGTWKTATRRSAGNRRALPSPVPREWPSSMFPSHLFPGPASGRQLTRRSAVPRNGREMGGVPS